ncbi:fungal-specific transcription factor domain-domain-containing protein [Coniella lustricola]|uniref:Fungal-specific transcription factor domain-domain-containing protein n=1 Tax=Coniella lustricola TaxID=2025994 RepID=A0A2T3A7V6_9PEZI|nr:fungal-specific transcription factor domain-domain-containing protein [Coniella lustricola]
MEPMDEDSPPPKQEPQQLQLLQQQQQQQHQQQQAHAQAQAQAAAQGPGQPPQKPSPSSHDPSVTSGSTPNQSTTVPSSGPSAAPHATSTAAGTPGQLDSSSGASGTPNTASGPVTVATSSSKRRRGLGVVTPNACTECRKKRAKCDGGRPCGRCKLQKDVECVYEIPVRQSKETLRTEIEQLRRQQRSNESVLAALARNDQWEEVVRRLRAGQSVEIVSEWLHGHKPAGSASMPNFNNRPARGANFTPIAAFSGVGANSFTPTLGTLGSAAPNNKTLSPISTAHPPSARPDLDPNSPWGTHSHFSTTSQAQSGRSNSHPDLAGWNHVPPQTRVGRWVEDSLAQMHEAEGLRFGSMDDAMLTDLTEVHVPATTWTSISADRAFVQHLLMLYFCWEYPTFASLSKEHFLKDFQAGRPRFCSPMLVNAILALGCRFSRQPSTLANPDDPYSSGDHFFKECQRLYDQEDEHHNLTTIQALGIMSIREASCGRDSESWYYAGQSIRLAIEMGLHRVNGATGDNDEVAVQAATFWGAFSLDHAWSLATGSLPQCSHYPSLPPKPAIIEDIEASIWIPYTDDGAPLQRSCEQPSNVRSVYKCFCELSELVHQALYMLHSPGRPITSRELLSIYTQFLNWYDKIPEVLRLGHNFTPAVLFAHMYYHFAILLLFRPFIKMRIIGSSISPRDVCCQAADAIQGLLRSYSQLYTLRRTPSFVPYFVLTSSIMHLAIAASDALSAQQQASNGSGQQNEQVPLPGKIGDRVDKAINQGIADLTEMAPCHHFAEQALNILRYLAGKWNIEVDVSFKRGTGGTSDREDSEGTTTPKDAAAEAQKTDSGTHLDGHATYGTRTATSSLNFFAPDVRQSDYISTLTSPQTQALSDTPAAATGDCMENPLFWPFPMQGRPMMPSRPMMKEAGFEMIP